MTASDSDPAVRLRNVMSAEPVVMLEMYVVYAAVVPPPDTFTMIASLAEMLLLVRVNVTAVLPASAALFIVMRPMLLFRVTPVDLLVN